MDWYVVDDLMVDDLSRVQKLLPFFIVVSLVNEQGVLFDVVRIDTSKPSSHSK